MPLARRIIPTVLVKGRTAVKGERFNAWRSIGLAIEKCRVHARRSVDEIMILDVSATAEGRSPDLDMVRELTAGCWVPVTVGGGVRSLQDIDALLRAGADKVCIGTGVMECLLALRDAPRRFGSQALVASMDWLGGWPTYRSGTCTVSGGASAVGMAKHLEAFGYGEILLQSIDRDGTMAGYDLDLIREVSQAVSIPVIASGGCSGPEDMDAAFKAGADAVAAGALFAWTDTTPKSAAQYLKQRGWEVRV